MSPPPLSKTSRHPSDSSLIALSEGTSRKRKITDDDSISENRNTKRTINTDTALRRETRNTKLEDLVYEDLKITVKSATAVGLDPPKRILRSRK